ncbi:hypothetical protein F5B20DRAFT_529276 [Whalleya microplaca]|nr:hypothetical protein F5B20DRAFT_529276 [Whalleya microplaca]
MLSAIYGKRQKFSSRPFYATVFVFTLITTYCVFVRGLVTPLDHQPDLFARSGEDCRLVHNAVDKCAYVKRNCHDDEAGLLDYLTFYYCNIGRAQPVAFIVLVLWLGLLFTTIGIAASDFFSVNLSTIATILGLSESLAGVTFLALGNGSPDVFSTFAAMGSNSGSMAVGELIGAAGFITSVVAGSMALVREFKVGTNTFVRDILFFVAAVSFAMGFLADGNLHLWECGVMIGFYLFYVIVVVGWHAIDKRRSARRDKEALSRSHFYATGSNHSSDELEPYRDEPDDNDTTPGERRTPGPTDLGMLERGPRIEVDAVDGSHESPDHNQHVAAEMASSMRVNRPRGRRSTTTITPIRPSLVGALEFRSILSSLQQEGNVRMRSIHHNRSSSMDLLNGGRYRRVGSTAHGAQSTLSIHGSKDSPVVIRSRALSSGAVPHTLDADLVPRDSSDGRGRPLSPHTIGGKLAPPLTDQPGGHPAEGSATEVSPGGPKPKLHRLRVPSPHGSERSSLSLSPFPAFPDSPHATSPNQQTPHLMLPSPAVEEHAAFPVFPEHVDSKPVRWWPYQLLPPPQVLFGTLFPTLQGWRSKGIWDKLISIISVPSIFLLVITLPVVESEATDDDPEDSIVDQPTTGQPNNTAAPVSFEPNGFIEPENEWQRYRRRTRSRASSRSQSPTSISINVPSEAQGSVTNLAVPVLPSIDVQPSKPASELGQDDSVITGDEDQGWNRWLLIVQIFTGPLFCVFIVWANMAEELDRPVGVLVKALLISLVCSLVLLGILFLTTSPFRRPKYHFMFCFLGFIISIAWISTIAGEVVGVLKAFGVILNISEAILGLTVFAVGNSVGDLVADVTVARLGYPVMALSACFGGPLLNILLGIGLGGAYQTIKAANKKKAKHPERPLHYKPYHIQVSGTLMVSAITLLLTLIILLTVVPMNKWVMSRKIGWGLIALWSISTAANLAIEITGAWQEIA